MDKGKEFIATKVWEENLPFGNILGSLFDGVLLILKYFPILRLSFVFYKNSFAGKKTSFGPIKEQPYNTYSRLTGNKLINAESSSKRDASS